MASLWYSARSWLSTLPSSGCLPPPPPDDALCDALLGYIASRTEEIDEEEVRHGDAGSLGFPSPNAMIASAAIITAVIIILLHCTPTHLPDPYQLPLPARHGGGGGQQI